MENGMVIFTVMVLWHNQLREISLKVLSIYLA